MPQEEMNGNLLDQAASAWWAGRRIDAGRLLYENIPEEFRPRWAARLLRRAMKQSGAWHAAASIVLHVADHPDHWEKAHDVFSTIRRFGLELDLIQQKTKQQQILVLVLVLAELVAKVTYNASRPADPFDHDAGWGIAACFKAVLDLAMEDDATRLAWEIISDAAQSLETPPI